MSHVQPNLFGDDRPGLPRDAKAYVPKAQHVRNRFIEFLAEMSAAETWPWDTDRVAFLRESVWPYLYERLPDATESADWKRRLDAEAARLDAAG